MADLSIQFHALPDEIIPLVCSFLDEVQACVSAIKYGSPDVFVGG